MSHIERFRSLLKDSRYHLLNKLGVLQSDQIKQSTIYIGLNDFKTGVQKYDTDKYMSILKHICRSYKVPFSVQKIEGGYFYENGEYTEETTLALLLVDVSEEIILEIAKDLCVFFNQESVMVVSSPCSVVFVREELLVHLGTDELSGDFRSMEEKEWK